MKKLLLIISAILIVGGGAGTYFVYKKDHKPETKSNTVTTSTTPQPNPSQKPFSVKKACDVLTLDDAKKVLGEAAKGGESNSSIPAESNDIAVSTCNYNLQGADVASNKIASVLARSAKTTPGLQSNQSVFSTAKPTGVQDVSGYGDKAFWNPQYGELNILMNNNWYIVTNGPIKATDRTLDEAKKLADIIVSKF